MFYGFRRLPDHAPICQIHGSWSTWNRTASFGLHDLRFCRKRPEGAVITSADGSETYGRAPVTIEYDRDTLEANLGKVPGFVATWPSGAKAATEAPYVVRDFKYGAQIELQRPTDAPGLEEDLRFALEQAQERAKRAEADRRRLQLYYQGGWMHGPFFGPGFWYFP